jgi:glycogen(starch) synthase
MADAPRCLILSNLYPPHHIGGYELGCRDLVHGLRGLGWHVSVLAGDHRRDEPCGPEEAGVERLLRFAPPPDGPRPLRELSAEASRELGLLRAMVARERPDCVLAFNTLCLHKVLLAELSRGPIPFTLLVSDHSLPSGLAKDPWFTYWAHPPSSSFRRILKAIARSAFHHLRLHPKPPAPAELLRSVLFTSDFLRRGHLGPGFAGSAPLAGRQEVLHWGVEPARIPARPPEHVFAGRIVYAGQLRHDKGAHTLIAAAGVLQRRGIAGFQVDIFGGTMDPRYVESLRDAIRHYQLDGRVTLRGEMPRDRLLAEYAAHDIMVFPSIWAEPFSIALLEGMAAGLCVIATPTGGTPEILEDGRNALLFPAGDADALAGCLATVIADPARAKTLAAAARATVCARFTLTGMTARLSEFLLACVGRAA